MLSRGLYYDRSASPASAGLVRNAIMVDTRMSARFDRNWTFPGAYDATLNRNLQVRCARAFGRSASNSETLRLGRTCVEQANLQKRGEGNTDAASISSQ